ncbi:MAG TPA: penicillin-binding protein 2 [Acidimicrobiales bacterium]|nr:penicillin-binding protein 2 [Acidimicrobiales bacterium]
MASTPGQAGTDAPTTRLRAMAIMVVVVCLFGTLLARLWYLQGVEAQAAQTKIAASEGLKTIYIPAPRGDIFDRNGVLLAGNRLEEVVTVDPGAATAHPSIVAELSALLGEPTAQVQAAIDNPEYGPYQPVPVATGVPESIVLAIDENQSLLPGVHAAAEPVRYYPYATTMANIIGYVSQITGSEYAAVKNRRCGGALCYQPNSQVGQAGIEATYEDYLRGTPGKEVVQVDSQGHVLFRVSYSPPVPGDDLVLSVSLKDQQSAVQALANGITTARGIVDIASGYNYRAPAASMVAEDTNNGQILALATYPDYNPDDFLGGISYSRWKYYNNPANHFPLMDRAVSETYAPGSTWKLITATAQLDYGLRSAYQSYDDTGAFVVGTQVFHDNLDAGLGWVNLPMAITVSSDSYFYSLGYQFWQEWASQKGHPEYLQKIAEQYGLGNYSGIDLPGEAPGLVPSQQVFTKEHDQFPKDYPDPYFYPGQEVLEAIGQGADEVTPLQLVNAYATFANGGTRYRPQVVMDIEKPGNGHAPSGKVVRAFKPAVAGHVTMPGASDRAAMLQGFEGVTANPQGTAYSAFQNFPLSRYPIAGKTGTAQAGPDFSTVGWPKYIQDTSVFSSFAPATAPRYAVDAIFEQSGYGSSVAAPAVESEYKTLLGIKKGKG